MQTVNIKFQNFNETGLLENPAARVDTPDIVEEDLNIEDIEINVPQPDANFNMAAVIDPIPSPSNRQPGLDPETINQLESVGLPFFANQGGIASLMSNKKPQQMVA